MSFSLIYQHLKNEVDTTLFCFTYSVRKGRLRSDAGISDGFEFLLSGSSKVSKISNRKDLRITLREFFL